MQLRKPKNHTVVDMYKAWCRKTLEDHSTYFQEYDPAVRNGNGWGYVGIIYEIQEGSKIMIMSYAMFRLILEAFNKYAVEAIIEGHTLSLDSKLGHIAGARIERNLEKIRCDMVATREARKIDSTHPAIFYTDPDLYIVWWSKMHKVKNETVYTFVPAKYNFRAKFYQAIRARPILKMNYKYYPYIHNKYQTQSA